MNSFLNISSSVILVYFFLITAFYMFLFFIAFIGLVKHKISCGFATSREILKARITPPVSVLVPAYNEEKDIIASVHSLLGLNYGEFEVIVVNDGSKDNTFALLQKEFELIKTSRRYNPQIPTKTVEGIYRSGARKNLIVVNKENGGKADSLNAGINAGRFPLFCSIDADSILEPDSLLRVVHPFMEKYASVVAAGGLINIINGCEHRGSVITDVKTSSSLLVNMQVVEYLRSFLAGRVGFNILKSNMIVSGAFGLFKKQPVIDCGGYRTNIVGEDMELVLRLQHSLRKGKKPCSIYFVPDTVCWTEAPERLKILSRQRSRWQRGLAESLFYHLSMLFNPRYGSVGFIGMPYFLFIEFLSPVVESFGYVIFITGIFTGAVKLLSLWVFILLAVFMGVIFSLLALLMQEVTFPRYRRITDMLKLIFAAVFENFGYRQYMAAVRMKGIIDWLTGKKSWGRME
ncbi:MAG TPA: glycosyltransferase, partial [bacterium]|nr:glycosyltransferase [bacterium]